MEKPMFTILVVEDEKEIRELFCTVLSKHGYKTIPAKNGLEALTIFESNYIDLIVSDLMMPEMDGYELVKSLRMENNLIPILIITAKDKATDKKEGFRLGTDDYMIKPIDVNEMIWRIEALLRRSRIISERKASIGSTLLDCDSLTVTDSISEQLLPQKEFLLLYKLISSPNRIFTRKQIMDDVWGLDTEVNTHTLEVHISRLRERFQNNIDFEIKTIRGLGYKVVYKNA
jgi:DNA-binding response OmpR family regulator